MDAAEHVLEEQAGGERQKSKSVAYDLRSHPRCRKVKGGRR